MKLISIAVFAEGIFLTGCSVKPRPVQIGKDVCAYCKMEISDERFATEAITKKGKIVTYDEIHCLLNDIQERGLQREDVKAVYANDFCGSHELLDLKRASVLQAEELRSPMGGNYAAFSSADSLAACQKMLGGQVVIWESLLK